MVITIFVIPSCTKTHKPAERWEGIRGDILRVYVRNNINIDYKVEKNEQVSKLNDLANERAEKILVSYYEVERQKRNMQAIPDNMLISEIVGTGKLVYMECLEDYCEAFMDYDISVYLKIFDGK